MEKSENQACLSSSDEEAPNKEADLASLEQYHQMTLFKCLQVASKTSRNKCLKIAEKFKESFRCLLLIYFNQTDWKQIFHLIEYLDSLVSKEPDLSRKIQSDEIMRTIGDFFFNTQLKLNAYKYYKKALQISNECNLLALESYENLLNLHIERWHFRMLNDRVRNSAYSRAILSRLNELLRCGESKDDARAVRVLDIGTGTGLLSALCIAQANKLNKNIQIYACETNEFFIEISKKFLSSFNLENNVKIINKHSNQLNIEEDLDNLKVDLIVTEIFDDGLLGENCLDTFYHAFLVKNLVNESSAPSALPRTIPKSARIYVCGIESDEIRRSNMFRHEFKSRTKTCQLNVFSLDNAEQFETGHDSTIYEPYTTENLNKVNFRLLTDILRVDDFNIEFDNLEFLSKFKEETYQTQITKRLTAKTSGRLDSIVVWFDLVLDNQTTITNSPFEEDSSKCWQQAIYSIHGNDLIVSNHSEIQVEIKLRKDCLLVKPVLDENVSLLKSDSVKEIDLKLQRTKINLLNNEDYQSFFRECFNEELTSTNDEANFKIAFFSSNLSFLFFEVLLLKKWKRNCEVFFILSQATNDTDQSELKSLLEKEFKKVKIVYLEKVLMNESEACLDFDYLICEPVDVEFGTLKKNFFTDLMLIKRLNKRHLKVFPNELQINGYCIESECLLNESELTNIDNLSLDARFDQCSSLLKTTLSDYYVRHQYSIDKNELNDLKQLTDTKTLLTFNLNSTEAKNDAHNFNQIISLDIKENGKLNAILYWFNLVGKNRTTATNLYAAISFYDQNNLIDARSNSKINLQILFKNNLFHAKFKSII